MTNHEKRTVRIATIGIAIYLAMFGGWWAWKRLEVQRAEYRRLVSDARNLKQKIQSYETKVMVAQKLMDGFHMDPAKLSSASVVAEASAAIQKAASSGGIALGPIRESPARASASELGSVQLEGSGPVPAVMTFLHRLGSVGYPLVVDSVQINQDPTKPGMVKLSLTIVILDFDLWKNEGTPHA